MGMNYLRGWSFGSEFHFHNPPSTTNRQSGTCLSCTASPTASYGGITRSLVALVLFGDVPKWSGQGHFEDTSGTRPGHVRPGTHF